MKQGKIQVTLEPLAKSDWDAFILANQVSFNFGALEEYGRGIGFAAWQAVEATFPQVKVWQTITPYYDQRNIHFYVNRCGFRIVEYFNAFHKVMFLEGKEDQDMLEQFPQGVFRFEKSIKK